MYTEFFGLSEKPFNLTPDPRFLYLSIKHREALAHLLFGIKSQSGFVLISGEIGTGKTTLCRSLLHRLDTDTRVSFIFNPALSPEELLRNINEDFGILSTAATIKGLIDELNDFLMEQAAKRRKSVLVIDEAQNLTPEVLEQIRLLSNLETETQKLLQIILIGQPELVESLELPELRQLNQRITARCHLHALNFSETLQYVAFRLRVAGGRGKVRFSRSAIRAVYRHSRGTPRVINAVCDRALLIGYTKNQKQVTKALVNRAAREIRGERLKPKRKLPLRRLLPNPTILATVVMVFVLVKLFTTQDIPLTNFPSDTLSNLNPLRPETYVVNRPAGPLGLPGQPDDLIVEASPIDTPAVEEAPAEPPLPPSFAEQLGQLSADETRTSASAAILRQWNMAPVSVYPSDDALESLSHFMALNGLVLEYVYSSLEQVLAVNLPAYMKVVHDDSYAWVGLVGLEGNHVELALYGDEPVRVLRDDFERDFLGEAAIPWKDPAPDTPVLYIDMEGRYVGQLKSQLRALGWTGTGRYRLFDKETEAVIQDIQAHAGLRVDGVVGRQTRMVVTSWLPSPPTPSVRRREALPLRSLLRVTRESLDSPRVPAIETSQVEEAAGETESFVNVATSQEQLQEAPSLSYQETTRKQNDESGITVEDLDPARTIPRLKPIVRTQEKSITQPAVGNTLLMPHGGDGRAIGSEGS